MTGFKDDDPIRTFPTSLISQNHDPNNQTNKKICLHIFCLYNWGNA